MQNLLNSIVFKVLILTVIGTLGAAVMVTGVKFLSDDLHPFLIAFFRCLSGLIILFPFIIKDNFKTLKTKNFKTHLLRSFFNCISMLTWFSAIGLMHLEKAAALGFTTPLFATILAVIILKEVIKIHRTIAVIMGFIGILIIIRPGYITVDSGTYLMIIASISWAFVLIIIKQLSKTTGWNSAAITPGTQFMDKLYKGVVGYFNNKDFRKLQIIISGSNDCGEGEHKIYKYIRENSIYHADTNTIIYGLGSIVPSIAGFLMLPIYTSILSILPSLCIHKLQQLNVKREYISKYMEKDETKLNEKNKVDISGNQQSE